MGSFDGTELCELIGIYIQSLLTDSIEFIIKKKTLDYIETMDLYFSKISTVNKPTDYKKE